MKIMFQYFYIYVSLKRTEEQIETLIVLYIILPGKISKSKPTDSIYILFYQHPCFPNFQLQDKVLQNQPSW